MIKKQFYVFIIWFLFCSPACLSSNIYTDNNLTFNSNQLSHFWKRGKGIEIDLNSLPPEEESDKLFNQPHDQNTNKIVESTLTTTKKRTKSVKAVNEEERKQRRALYEKNRRREQREIWNEAKKDPTKLTPEIQKAMDKYIQSQRNRQKRYYRSLSKKFKEENFASEAQSHTWHHMRQTPEWRAESDKNEAKYQRRLKVSREYKKQKRANERLKKNSIQKRDLFNDELALEDYPFYKRANNGLDIDLNSSPPKEEDKPQDQKNGEQTSAGQKKKKLGRPRVLTDAERKENKRIYSYKKRKERSEIWKEAQNDTKKMTPEIQKAIDKHREAQRKRQRRYHAKIEELVETNQPLTQKQYIAYHQKHKTLEWRSLSPINEARYQRRLQKERDRKREVRKKLKAQKDGQNSSTIQKRDLNGLSDDSIFQKRGISSDVSPSAAHLSPAQLDPDSHPSNSQPNQEVDKTDKPKRTRKTAEEKKQARNETIRRWRAKRKTLWDESLSDPTKLTPKIESEMKRHYESRRQRVKRYYQSIKSKVENNKELSPAQFKLYHLWRRTPTWRAASNKNQAAYEQHKSDNNKRRRKDRENKQKDSKGPSPEPPLQKRAIDTGIDLNRSPPREDDDSQAPVKLHSRKKKPLSMEEKRERSKIYKKTS